MDERAQALGEAVQLALVGESSRRAAGLLRSDGPLEKLLAQGRFKEQASELRLYRWIATMDKFAPLQPLQDQTPS